MIKFLEYLSWNVAAIALVVASVQLDCEILGIAGLSIMLNGLFKEIDGR